MYGIFYFCKCIDNLNSWVVYVFSSPSVGGNGVETQNYRISFATRCLCSVGEAESRRLNALRATRIRSLKSGSSVFLLHRRGTQSKNLYVVVG